MSTGANGLEGVVVADTALSDVDGERGELWIRGEPVERLAVRQAFAEVLGLLTTGELPEPTDGRIPSLLSRGRSLAHRRLSQLGDALDQPNAMDALRAGVAHFRDADLGPGDEAAAVLAGVVATLAAAWACRQRGEALPEPDPAAGHADDVLRLLGARPGPAGRALDAYWIAVIDHGLNASTFAARVVASTGSDLISAVTAAIGALKGPLHGGAPGPVLDMLDAIGSEPEAEPWLRQELAAGRRIMGMGHRIYRVRDPRALVLEQALSRYRQALGQGADPVVRRLELARHVERVATRLLSERHPSRPLAANVEFFTAVLLEAIGVPRSLFSAMFAASRVVGWCAHVAEQRASGRLIRPASRYVGARSGAAPAA